MWMINMKAVLDIVSQYCPDDDGSCSKAGVDLREMLDEIEGLDETEVEPVKYGRWVRKHNSFPQRYFCTECGGGDVGRFAFCHHCGVKMMKDGES